MTLEAIIRKRKVFLVMPTLDIGGAERQFVLLSTANIPGFEIFLISLFPSTESVFSTVENCTYLYSRRSEKKLGLLIQLIFAPLRLAQVIKRERLQGETAIIYSGLYYGNFISWIASFFVKDRILLWGLRATETQNRALFSKVMVILCKWVSWSVQFAISNSYAGVEAHHAMGFRIKKTAVIHNFIDSKKFEGRRRDKFNEFTEHEPLVIGMMSRLIQFKGHEFVLEGLKTQAFERKVRLVIAGDGAAGYVLDLKKKAKEVLYCDVEFGGLVRNPVDFYDKIDIFLTASNSGEGFSNSLGEAMAMGLPCLVSDVGDSALVLNDKTFTFPARDTKCFLSCLEQMISLSSSERLELGIKNRKQIQALASKEVFEKRHAVILEDIVTQNEA